jgi:hypothetical protein
MSVITHCSEEVAQLVAYEIAAFDRLSTHLRLSCRESGSFIPEEITLLGTGHGDEDRWELSAEIESLLMHTRVLREFFYYFWDFKEKKYKSRREKNYNDDVIAQDFIPDWIDQCPPIGRYLGDISNKERLDKSLAHLSTKRVEYKQKEKRWEIETIHGELWPAINRFNERLPVHMVNWFVLKVVE